MKKFLILHLLLSVLYTTKMNACHGVALFNYTYSIGASGVTINAFSQSSTCGCGPYWMVVKIDTTASGISGTVPASLGATLTGWTSPATTHTSFPWYCSLLNITNYQAPNWTDQCLNEPYHSIFISFADLCPGKTYYFGAHEYVGGSAAAGPWTAIGSFTVPGTYTPLTANVTADSDSICSWQCTTINITNISGGASTGVIPTWSHGLGTGVIKTVCPTTTTTYTVTFNPGCPAVAIPITINVTTATQFNATLGSSTNVTCNGSSNGTAAVNVSGGTGQFTYMWTPNGDTTPAVTDLSAGTYTCVVTDGVCAEETVVSITQPLSPLAISYSVTSASCAGNDGSIDLTTTGGNTPYSYNWPLYGNTEDLSGINAGNYLVTVTDSNNCVQNELITVVSQAGISLSTTTTNPLCNGDLSGSVDLTVTGGTGTYTYAWNNMQVSEDLINLAAGNYSVTISDASNCVASAVVILTEPTPIQATLNSTNVDCNGNNTGSIDLNVTGGTLPYSYLWSNSSLMEDISSLTPGTYTVNVTDANGCASVSTATVTEPTAITLSATITNVLCNADSSGEINLTATGGTGVFNYAWSNAQNSEDVSGLMTGTYSVNVTDFNNCFVTDSFIITQPPALSATSLVADINCNGAANGFIDITVAGGIPPYNYVWNNTAASEDIDSLAPGNYSVTVTDSNGCNTSLNGTITEPTPLVTSYLIVDEWAGNDGAIDLSVNGGSPGYTFYWNTGDTIEDLISITGGTYWVTITDSNNCTVTDTVLVQTTLTIPEMKDIIQTAVHPNPSSSVFHLTFRGEPKNLKVYDAQGRLVISKNSELSFINLGDSASGIYTILIYFENSMEMLKVIKD